MTSHSPSTHQQKLFHATLYKLLPLAPNYSLYPSLASLLFPTIMSQEKRKLLRIASRILLQKILCENHMEKKLSRFTEKEEKKAKKARRKIKSKRNSTINDFVSQQLSDLYTQFNSLVNFRLHTQAQVLFSASLVGHDRGKPFFCAPSPPSLLNRTSTAQSFFVCNRRKKTSFLLPNENGKVFFFIAL